MHIRSNDKTVATIILLILMVFLSPSVMAREQAIYCPLKEAQASVTNRLPKGWWTTPQGGRLAALKTMNIGGKMTMVCIYDVFGKRGSIMHEFPVWAKFCKTDLGQMRFVCSSGYNKGGPRVKARKAGVVEGRPTVVVRVPSTNHLSKKNCGLRPEHDTCKGNFTGYFYNSNARRCEAYTYGGCIEPPFSSMKMCQASCLR